ncbi:DUF881 domain-containing protein [Alicyclobacillus sp. SO9]|uniref:DUF881 domain-containing protein n=1 Tax=Alicyclobacillus sp. SO9 TaxID=2665646 RepID=UPI0018E860E2|nr:DUF881 domain-containing protein [Alicyclobacillus sp. SO9]QQE80708.1 DUF881 domain-containing protein [Alicyclobacillus sp. SO9]
MTTKSKLAVSLTLVSIVLGFMISVQYEQSSQSRQLTSAVNPSQKRIKALAQKYNLLQKVGQQEQKQLAVTTTQLTHFEKQAAGNNQQLQQLSRQLDAARILAGTTAVKGAGIVLTVTDGNPPPGKNPENYIAHDWYMRQLVNELFAAGSEAVAINGVRFVSTSGIFCGGPVVTVNNNQITAPFKVEAIGDPRTLERALNMPNGEIDALRNKDNLNVSPIQTSQSLKLPAYTGTTITPLPTANGN